MKASAKSDDSRFRIRADRAAPASCELERAFVGLCSRIAEEHLRRERVLHQKAGETLSRFRSVEIRYVDESRIQDALDGPRNSRVSVAERVYRNAAREIEICLVVFVEQLDARSTYESHRRALVGAKYLARNL